MGRRVDIGWRPSMRARRPLIMDIWGTLKHFHRDENWGDPDRVEPKLLLLLDRFRDECGVPFHVSSCLRLDNPDSAHYPNDAGLSEAVDIIPMRSKVPSKILDIFLLATKFPFNGIGIYNWWMYTWKHPKSGNPVRECGGLHLDISSRRRLPTLHSSGHWIGLRFKQYRPVTYHDLEVNGFLGKERKKEAKKRGRG